MCSCLYEECIRHGGRHGEEGAHGSTGKGAAELVVGIDGHRVRSAWYGTGPCQAWPDKGRASTARRAFQAVPLRAAGRAGPKSTANLAGQAGPWPAQLPHPWPSLVGVKGIGRKRRPRPRGQSRRHSSMARWAGGDVLEHGADRGSGRCLSQASAIGEIESRGTHRGEGASVVLSRWSLARWGRGRPV